MKKYLFSLIAVVLALAASSFTMMKKHAPTGVYVFEYNPNGTDYSLARVTNVDKAIWVYKGIDQPMCSSINTKACRVSVTSADVNMTTTPYSLKASTVSISAAPSLPSVYYVTGITGTTSAFSNKP